MKYSVWMVRYRPIDETGKTGAWRNGLYILPLATLADDAVNAALTEAQDLERGWVAIEAGQTGFMGFCKGPQDA